MKIVYSVLAVILIILFGIFFIFFFSIRETAQGSHTLSAPKNGNIYVIAHRGAHNGIPENSLPAYQKAIDLGADFIEVDIRVTKDGKLVSCHNDKIDAYTKDKTGEIGDFTLAELKQIDIGIKTGPEWEGTYIPTLEEILQICQGKCDIYLDLKDAPVNKLVALLKKHNMESHALWYSPVMRFWTFNSLKTTCPECIPMPDPVYTWMIQVTLNKMNPTVIAATRDVLSPQFVSSCHDAGAIIIVDEDDPDPDDWQKMIDWGVDGIQTDDPKGLINFLRNNN